MTTYLVQYRLVKLPSPDAEPDRWSSATSTMTLVEASAPIDAGSDDDATAVAALKVRDLADQLAATHSTQAASDALKAQVPKLGPDGATGYKVLDEPMVASAFVMDDVFVASAAVDDQPAINFVFLKDGKAAPGMTMVGADAEKAIKVAQDALRGAKEYIARTTPEERAAIVRKQQADG